MSSSRPDPLRLTRRVRNLAHELGFQAVGFSKAAELTQEARRLEEWLGAGMHADMGWMENHFDLRIDPRKLVPGAQSVITLAASYHAPDSEGSAGIRLESSSEQNPSAKSSQPAERLTTDHSSIIRTARYAKGRDYHRALRKPLKTLLQEIRSLVGDVQGRVFVDSAPVMEKAWAVRSGLGWLGKNGNVLNRGLGSWFLLCEIVVDAVFVYDAPGRDHCGTCTRCIDACPTGAIPLPSVIDSNRCISYLTIEYDGRMPEEFRERTQGWAFGCDICQEVCPWNRKARTGRMHDLQPRGAFAPGVADTGSSAFWRQLTEPEFEEWFRGTPLMRSGYSKMMDSVAAASGSR